MALQMKKNRGVNMARGELTLLYIDDHHLYYSIEIKNVMH
jgi:hypothetical protein